MNDPSPIAATHGIGRSVRRREDRRLLTGNGRYTDDLMLPGQAHIFVLRSPHAHAEIAEIVSGAARSAAGVLAVLTAADYLADGLKPMAHAPASTSPPDIRLENTDGSAIEAPLAHGRVRFVGEPVALVVAETLAQAKDAAEL
jgi:carbon-monoxide dehydrogenase large subunit